MNRSTFNQSISPDADIRVEHDREWLVLVIERIRRTRRVYLLPDEAARVAAVLSAELPEVVTRQLTPRERGTNPRALGTNPRAQGTNPRNRT